MSTDRKTHYCQGVSSSNLVRTFTAIPRKITASYFVVKEKLILKFIRGGKRPRITNIIVKEKNKVGNEN